MEQKEFYKILHEILDEIEVKELKGEEKEAKIFRLLDQLIYQSEASDVVKEQLKLAYNKFAEGRMWLRYLTQELAKYD